MSKKPATGKRTKGNSERLSISLSPETNNKLEELSKLLNDMPISQVVGLAIERFYNKEKMEIMRITGEVNDSSKIIGDIQ